MKPPVPPSDVSGAARAANPVDSAHALEQELARRLLNLTAGLIFAFSGGFLLANLWSGLWPEAILAVGVVAGTTIAWRHAQRTAQPVRGMRLLVWTTFLGLSGGLLRQGSTLGPAIWWLSALPVLLLQGGALVDGVVMTALIILEAAFVVPLAALLAVAPVDPALLGAVRRDIAIVGALLVNGFVMLMGIRWRRELLAQLDAARLQSEDAALVKSRFLANMSHEIRTPLHGIVGAAELLRGSRLDEGQRQVLSVLRRSSASLLALVNDVLDFSKLEAGRMRVERVAFDLHDAIHDAAEVFSAQAEAKGIELLSHCTADLPQSTVGDAARLRQILHNLVGNAVKFTAAGEVRVFAAPERGPDGSTWVRVSVRDTGIGMTATQVAGLFEAFSQADLSTTRRFGGSGLGLAIARELAELLGGRIEVHSLPEQGSTFMLMMPLVGSAPAAPAPSLFAGVQVQVVSPQRSRREDLAELVQRHGGRCEALESLPAPGASHAPGTHAIVMCDDRALAAAGLSAADWADRLAASGARGVLIVGLSADARQLPRELLPVYRPATPARVLDALQRAIAGHGADSARMDLDGGTALDGTRPPRVLLVEDNPVNQLVARALLERLGATVALAGDGAQALQRVAESEFDLVLMDCQMPVMDGLACTRALRERETRLQLRRLPVVAMTAAGDDDARDDCREAGMDDFLTKPVDQLQFAAVLARVMRTTAP